jgi:hypothetical protein
LQSAAFAMFANIICQATGSYVCQPTYLLRNRE